MKWSMDTHKYISETTRKALQIMVAHNITSNSDPQEIECVEKELGSGEVYKDYESAKGRVRRALFTYFKAYGCLDDDEQLTEIGKLYCDNKLSVREFSFNYIVNYLYEEGNIHYYPTQFILQALDLIHNIAPMQAYISAYDFSKIVECDSLEEINEGFIQELISARGEKLISVNERQIGFDVWAKMLVQSGILMRDSSRNLVAGDYELVSWILAAYKKNPISEKGKVCTGILSDIPIIPLFDTGRSYKIFEKEGKAARAYLVDSIDDKIIQKYIFNSEESSFEEMKNLFGFTDSVRGYYRIFSGIERLLGHSLAQRGNSTVRALGEIIASVKLSESEITDIAEEEPNLDFVYRLATGQNILLYGVPGSGKSWTIEHEYCKPESVVERIVFHPDYTYSDFVGQILPDVSDDGAVSYKFTPGPFTNILSESYKNPDKEYILIIEEINRGNAPAIFGEIFQLLDRKVEVNTYGDDGFPIGTSVYGITNLNIAEIMYGKDRKTEKVRIPSNLSIIGTMNTSDQNVFTLDTAFQRRWDMRLIENNFNNVDSSLADAEILDTSVSWKRFCLVINKIIVGNNARMTSSEDKRIGAYFVHPSDLKYDDRMGDLNEYDNLRKLESKGYLTKEEGGKLSIIREAMKQNRRFPEKVIKYLWDDAFKFNREIVFDTPTYQSLEDVIHAFIYAKEADRFKIFKDDVRSSLTETVED